MDWRIGGLRRAPRVAPVDAGERFGSWAAPFDFAQSRRLKAVPFPIETPVLVQFDKEASQACDIVSQERDDSHGSPRSFAAQRALAPG